MAKLLAKLAYFYAGIDLLGARTSMSDRNAEMEVTPLGIKMTSKGNGRIVLIPWPNVKGIELHPDAKSKE